MPGNYLFEYAVIRFVPKVEREEFLNLGVLLYCRDRKFLEVKYAVDESRLLCFAACPNLEQLIEYLDAFKKICQGSSGGGPIGTLDIASRFRWLTATRSTIVQTSKVHPGLCKDPSLTLEKLYLQLVL